MDAFLEGIGLVRASILEYNFLETNNVKSFVNWTGSQMKIMDYGDWKKVSRSQLISLGATVVLGKFVSNDYVLTMKGGMHNLFSMLGYNVEMRKRGNISVGQSALFEILQESLPSSCDIFTNFPHPGT